MPIGFWVESQGHLVLARWEQQAEEQMWCLKGCLEHCKWTLRQHRSKLSDEQLHESRSLGAKALLQSAANCIKVA